MNLESHEVFQEELSQIPNKQVRDFITYCLDNAPKYFYHIPASSSGKYHPLQDLGEGGLVRHTRAVFQVGMDLLRCEQFVEDNDINRTIVGSASLLHDIIKNGIEGGEYTVSEHPILACRFTTSMLIEYIITTAVNKRDDLIEIVLIIEHCVRSHMGKWNTDREKNEILPVPKTDLEKLVHLADYIASRKYIDFSYLNEENM